MKRILVVLLIITISTLVFGCNKELTDEEIYYEMQKKLSNVESYKCIADTIVIGNKAPVSYKAKHIFLSPNKYIIEILEPQENKGNITLYDGTQAWLYNPNIEESFLIKDYKQTDDGYLFLGYFLKNFITSEETEVSTDKIEEDEYIVLTAEIPGNHKYRELGKLWISKKGFIPYKLIVFSNNNNISAEVIYSEFEYNIEIDEEQFNIKTGIETIKGL